MSFWPSQEERCKWSCPTDSCEHRPRAPIKAIIRPSRQSGLPTRLGIGWLRMVKGMGRIGWGGGWLYFFPLFMLFILNTMHLSNESWHWKYIFFRLHSCRGFCSWSEHGEFALPFLMNERPWNWLKILMVMAGVSWEPSENALAGGVQQGQRMETLWICYQTLGPVPGGWEESMDY